MNSNKSNCSTLGAFRFSAWPLIGWLMFLFHSIIKVQGFCPTSVGSPLLSNVKSSSSQNKHQKGFVHRKAASFLFLSESDSADIPKRRRKRVRRKDAPTTVTTTESEQPPPSVEAFAAPAGKPAPKLIPREDAAVNLQVQDVRDLVGQYTSSSSAASDTMEGASAKSTSATSSSSNKQQLSEDSLEMLLQDAKELQAMEKDSSKEVLSSKEEGGFSIGGTLKNALSTLVTVDFFVVCAFLLWFLAGIFCSYILKDDTVQIAFNSKFFFCPSKLFLNLLSIFESGISCVGLCFY